MDRKAELKLKNKIISKCLLLNIEKKEKNRLKRTKKKTKEICFNKLIIKVKIWDFQAI